MKKNLFKIGKKKSKMNNAYITCISYWGFKNKFEDDMNEKEREREQYFIQTYQEINTLVLF